MNDLTATIIIIIVCIALGFFTGILTGLSIGPTMKDVFTLDNRRCILIYEQDVVHKFCEAK